MRKRKRMIRTNVAGAPIVVMSALWLKARSEFLSLCLQVRVSSHEIVFST
jgi:hypothetical protein